MTETTDSTLDDVERAKLATLRNSPEYRIAAQLAAKEQECSGWYEQAMVSAKALAEMTDRAYLAEAKLTAAEERAEAYRLAAGPCTPYREIGATYCQHGFKPGACVFRPYPHGEHRGGARMTTGEDFDIKLTDTGQPRRMSIEPSLWDMGFAEGRKHEREHGNAAEALAIAVEALEFYALRDRYIHDDGQCAEICTDEGDIARSALDRIEKMGK